MARRQQPTTPRYNSLIAAAEVMVSPRVPLVALSAVKPADWQNLAWSFFDTVGELRFGATWISNAMSRVNLVAASRPGGPGDEPTAIDTNKGGFTDAERRAAEIVAGIAGGQSGQGLMLGQFGTHLTIAGICWLIAEPEPNDPTSDEYTRWRVLSGDEVRIAGDIVEIADGYKRWRTLHENAVLVRCWTPHPRRAWEPDAPTRAVLGVLREIELLQMHISASAQSRLAGAGLLAIPSEAVFPPGQGPQSTQSGIDADDQNITPPEDTFVETLVEAMTVPITDRGSAAAVVPLVVRVPGEFLDKIKHITFATPFDDRVLELLSNAIKRLALGLDIPPEILTGTGGMNHWGAWQVEEQAITLHVEPKTEVVCHALTEGFLRPALEAEGYDASGIMVWYDTTDLRARPDKSRSAVEAYDRDELSGAALLRELGLSVDDAPTPQEKREKILLGVAKGAPTLAPAMLSELGYLESPIIPTEENITPVDAAPPVVNIPTNGPPARPGGLSDLHAAADVLVWRALERAGARLRSAAGRNVKGGAAAVACPDPVILHTAIRATDYATLDALLDGAWSMVPAVARRTGIDPAVLEMTLDRYTRDLIETGRAHDADNIATVLSS